MNRLLTAFSLKRNIKLLLFRPSTNMAPIDGFRAMSIMLVLAFHAFAIFAVLNPKVITLPELVEQSGWLWAWVWNSDKGVDIFFVISGYLITGILLRQIDAIGHIRMSNFYFRRFLRLTPVYYVVIGIYVLIKGPNLHNIWANMLYVNNFLPYDEQAMNWTWSLAIEEQFYLVYPILLGLVMKHSQRPIVWMWLAYGVSFLICLAVILTDEAVRTTPGSVLVADPKAHAHHFGVLYDNLYTRYGALLAGGIAAYYQHYQPERVNRFFASAKGQWSGWVALVLVVGLMSMPVLTKRFDEWQNLAIFYQTSARNLFAAGIAILMLISTERGMLAAALRKLMGHPVWYPIAQLSYSMYLLHVLAVTLAAAVVGQWVTKYPEKFPWDAFESIGVVFVLSFILTLFLSTLCYLFLERPIMNLRK